MATPNQPLPTSMRAAQFSSINGRLSDSLKVNQIAGVPSLPTKNGLFIKVITASPNPIDFKLAETLPSFVRRIVLGSLPITPATDFVGRVWASTNPDFKGGDLVFGKLSAPNKYGTCADFTVVTGNESVAKVPAGFDYSRISELGVVGVAALTALQSLKVGGLPPNGGGSVFINGASGGVGTYTVQMAKKVFNCENVVVACSAANADLVKSLGADEVIDYRSTNVPEALKAWVKRSGKKFDHVVDNVGSDQSLYFQTHEYLKEKEQGGKYVQVGGDISLGAVARMLNIYLRPSFLGGGKRPYEFLAVNFNREDYENIGKWISEGKVRSVIEDENRFDLADTAAAFKKLESGRVRGNIAIEVSK